MEYDKIRAGSGVVIFNSRKQFIFADQKAIDFLNGAGHPEENGHTKRKFGVPTEISRILSELENGPKRFKSNCSRGITSLKRFVFINTRCYLIRAFIISDQRKRSSTHFLVLLENLAKRSRNCLERVRSHYHMSLREFEVVQLLVGGLTNKEIGNKLNIAESTVKEYLCTVMRKAGVSTRSGLVARILGYSDGEPVNSVSNGEKPLSQTLKSKRLSLESPGLETYTEAG